MLRRLKLVFLAAAIMAGPLLLAPPKVAAACYYGPWKTDTREVWAMAHNVHVKSQVTFRLGYTCGGSTTGEWHVTERKMWLDIWGNQTYQGPERYWSAHHLYRSWSNPGDYSNPGRHGVTAEIHWSRTDGQDVYGSTADPFVYYWCSACTPSGMGNFWGEHHFLVPQRMWLNWNGV